MFFSFLGRLNFVRVLLVYWMGSEEESEEEELSESSFFMSYSDGCAGSNSDEILFSFENLFPRF